MWRVALATILVLGAQGAALAQFAMDRTFLDARRSTTRGLMIVDFLPGELVVLSQHLLRCRDDGGRLRIWSFNEQVVGGEYWLHRFGVLVRADGYDVSILANAEEYDGSPRPAGEVDEFYGLGIVELARSPYCSEIPGFDPMDWPVVQSVDGHRSLSSLISSHGQ